MKKILFLLLAFVAMFVASCSNEAIDIETSDPVIKDAVTVNVPLSGFFSSYNFYDTKHGRDISDVYRTFNSESGLYILCMTLFYDKATGVLKKGIYSHSKDINSKVIKADLPEGNYYVITTLSFSTSSTGLSADTDFWSIAGNTNLRTAKMVCNDANSMWAIMSVSTDVIEVKEGKHVPLNVNPQPIGALCYLYFHNFQYKNEASTTVSDNGIRQLSLYTQQKAISYNLDPNATSKYNYLADAGENFWYYLSVNTPDMFDDEWTFFKSNLYDYSYILAPSCKICFGYTPEGSENFNAYGEAVYNIQNGKTYLAYWDWFQVGNPYFGIADNNHWNDYSGSRAPEDVRPSKQNIKSDYLGSFSVINR